MGEKVPKKKNRNKLKKKTNAAGIDKNITKNDEVVERILEGVIIGIVEKIATGLLWEIIERFLKKYAEVNPKGFAKVISLRALKDIC